MQIDHKKNSAYYLAVPMVDSATPSAFKSGETVTDTAFYKDGAGAWTSLAITDTFSEIGTTGIYEIDLTASEMNHDQVIIKMTSGSAAASLVIFKMFTNDVDTLATQTSVNTIDDFLDTEIASIISSLSTIAGYIDTEISTIMGYLDTEIAALVSELAKVPKSDSTVIWNTTAANQLADALLNRDMSAVSDTTARSPLNALRFLRNKYSITGSTLTVTKEDDTTAAWTSALTTDAGANPVTGSDPA